MQRALATATRLVRTPVSGMLKGSAPLVGRARGLTISSSQNHSNPIGEKISYQHTSLSHKVEQGGVEIGQLRIPQRSLVRIKSDAQRNADALIETVKEKWQAATEQWSNGSNRIPKVEQDEVISTFLELASEVIATLNNGGNYNFTRDFPQDDQVNKTIYDLVDLSDKKFEFEDTSGKRHVVHPRLLLWKKDSPVHSHPAGGSLDKGDASCIAVAVTNGQTNTFYDRKYPEGSKSDAVLPGGYMVDKSANGITHEWTLQKEALGNVSSNSGQAIRGMTMNLYRDADVSAPAPGQIRNPIDFQ